MSERTSFRPDVQGMRAVAVLTVICAHAGFTWMSGGFIGVDVFFVISGYLIIGLLLREGSETSRISILGFYARRVRRIMPAAATVLAATVLASAYLLPVLRATEVLKDAIWAVFFGANIRFASVETDYFAKGEPPSPLQHYWSLSVEEQFYLVIPTLLFVVLLVAGRRRARGEAEADGGARFRRVTFVTLLVGVACSLGWAVHMVAVDRAAAYFSTPARVWELGIGGLLAVLVHGTVRLPRWVAEVAAWAGLAMIAYAALAFDAHTLFPSWPALVPVLGAALVLGAGATAAGQRTYAARGLALLPLRWIGDLSYSLYLWHFPVFRLAGAHWGEKQLSTLHAVECLVVILALSVASYYLVEQPVRQRRFWKPTRVAMALYPAGVLTVAAAVLGAHVWVHAQLSSLDDNPAIAAADYKQEGLSKDPAVGLVQASVYAARDHRPIPGHLQPDLFSLREDTAPLGDCDYRTGTEQLCPYGDADADRSIVVLGDSHARAWGPAFDALGKKYGYAVYQFVFSGCPANSVTRWDPANGGAWTACSEFKDWAIQEVGELQPDLAVVSNASYLSSRLLNHQVRGLHNELAALQATGTDVAVVGNTPKVDRLPGSCLTTRGADLGDCLLTANEQASDIQLQFGKVAERMGGTFVDAGPWFCVKLECPAVVGRTVTLRDTEHMTVEYAVSLADPLAAALGLTGSATQAEQSPSAG